MAQGKATFSFTDYDGDNKQISFRTFVASDVNFASWDSAVDGLRDAIVAVSAGVLAVDNRSASYAQFDNGTATSPVAQAHQRAIVQYLDTVTSKIYQDYFIACPNLGDGTLWKKEGGLTVADLTNADWVAFQTAFELLVYSVDENTVTLQKIWIEE